MALTETSTITEIMVLPLESAVQVKWRNVVKRDGDPISANDHYRVYTEPEKAIFLADVPGAAGYVALLGWA